MGTTQSLLGFGEDIRKQTMLEAYRMLHEFAERETIDYTIKLTLENYSKILKKEANNPGIVDAWLSIDKPTKGIL